MYIVQKHCGATEMELKYFTTYENWFTMDMKLRMTTKIILEVKYDTREIVILYKRIWDEANISSGNTISPFAVCLHFVLGALNPHFFGYTVWVTVHAYLLFQCLEGLLNRLLFILSWFPWRFIPSFEFCILHKTAFTSMYFRIAVVFLVLLCAVLFRLTALGKGLRSSHLNDTLDGGSGSAHAFLEGSGSG